MIKNRRRKQLKQSKLKSQNNQQLNKKFRTKNQLKITMDNRA